MKKTIFLCFCLILIFSASVSCAKSKKTDKESKKKTTTTKSKETTTTSKELKEGWKEIKSKDGLLTIYAPEDWKHFYREEADLSEISYFVIFGPEEGGYPTLVHTAKETVPDKDLVDYISDFEQESTGEYSDVEKMELINEEEITIDNNKATRRYYNVTPKEDSSYDDLKHDIVFIQKGDNIFTIQSSATVDLYKSVSETFDEIIESIQLK